MGIAFAFFFGDKTKEELEAELARIDRESEKLAAEKAEIQKVLKEKYDCSAEG